MDAAFAEWVRLGLTEAGPLQWCGREPYSVIFRARPQTCLRSLPNPTCPFDVILMCLDRESGKRFLQAFAMDKYKLISVDGMEHREVEPHKDIVDTEHEIQELERYANNPHIYFELFEKDYLIETNVSQLQGTLPSAIHRLKCHNLLKGSVQKVLHSCCHMLRSETLCSLCQ